MTTQRSACTLFLVALCAFGMIVSPGVVRAAPSGGASESQVEVEAHGEGPDVAPSTDALFDALEEREDPSLESHRAGDLTATELVVSIVCMVIFLPLGIGLLIFFLVDDEEYDVHVEEHHHHHEDEHTEGDVDS